MTMENHSLLTHSSRRGFLKRAGLGCGSLALTSLLHQEGIIKAAESNNPLAAKNPHFNPKA
ncbi:MAG: hypothetical protein ACI9HK_003566, partial [Pirellulaceae bacterium]